MIMGIDEAKSNRDVDAYIACYVYGWVLLPIGKDANGENAGEVLFPHKDVDQSWFSALPLIGKPHPAYFVPKYTSDIRLALELCQKVKYNQMTDLHQMLKLDPYKLCIQALQHYNEINGSKLNNE